ncbi:MULTISPECIES: M20 family metallopeptidase [unclassified Mycolicibacterium]|uniref:M20 metallopeptidase family protein n=1 Tax=unclassified Mycolicibacterium TaxID=2636767 RepID=UPI0012DC9A35|nr:MULTISPECIES: M20 family metallopeptidase [unclassified Mycolicibacterium]MUL84742.1 amidohydrolase [Mycolicibacterium sp. CBMA 329]MUL88517.1 amidohydrolase [Mycolicibacterium sp. CBMA 331]MUM00144.1 amidohydrolase [Mycolicibacterium sp. CBMA 334]MUM40164.1 amidohydrolase [Mycolicibacterium sp. CBMA 247]MUM44582.1 amidohydrolase [Mycolicibacterium sp. CBMA 294]
MTSLDELWALVQEELPNAIALRRELHQYPDVSGREGPTRDQVLAALAAVDPIASAGTGAVVRIGGRGPSVAVRGEMDGLAITESTGVDWESKNPGAMHACGHDVHMAGVVALARAVRRAQAPVPLVVVLQPREESYPSGARDMAEDTWLAEQQCAVMIGAHLQPQLDPGVVSCTPGVVNASSDELHIVVEGAGGHAAYPHLAADPVHALAHVITSLQAIVARNTDPMASAVVSVTTLSAGNARNVIPDRAEAGGTIRALSLSGREETLTRVTQIAQSVAAAHGCQATVHVERGEPALFNEPVLTEIAGELARHLGSQTVHDFRSAGSDDFAFFSERIPSAMFFVGVESAGVHLHSPGFLPPDESVADIARVLLAGYWAAAGRLVAGSSAGHEAASSPVAEAQ